jgi:hypothetical protein
VEQSSRRLSLEEIVNSTTRGVGLALSVAGFVVLLAKRTCDQAWDGVARPRLHHLRQHSHLPLSGVNALSRHPLATAKACTQNLGPLGKSIC